MKKTDYTLLTATGIAIVVLMAVRSLTHTGNDTALWQTIMAAAGISVAALTAQLYLLSKKFKRTDNI